MTEDVDFIWRVGERWTRDFTVTDSNGNVVALDVDPGTEATHAFIVTVTLDDVAHVLKLDGPGEVSHTAAGVVTVVYDPVALDPGRYRYSLVTTNPALGSKYVVAQGTVVVERTANDVPGLAI